MGKALVLWSAGPEFNASGTLVFVNYCDQDINFFNILFFQPNLNHIFFHFLFSTSIGITHKLIYILNVIWTHLSYNEIHYTVTLHPHEFVNICYQILLNLFLVSLDLKIIHTLCTRIFSAFENDVSSRIKIFTSHAQVVSMHNQSNYLRGD